MGPGGELKDLPFPKNAIYTFINHYFPISYLNIILIMLQKNYFICVKKKESLLFLDYFKDFILRVYLSFYVYKHLSVTFLYGTWSSHSTGSKITQKMSTKEKVFVSLGA